LGIRHPEGFRVADVLALDNVTFIPETDIQPIEHETYT